MSRYHKFAASINERPNFYNIFNIKAMEIYDFSILLMSKSGVPVTKEYVLSQLYYMESYLHVPSTVKEEKKNSPRLKECGTSQMELARNLYLMRIMHIIHILEHGLAGGGPSRSDKHEGRRWKKI
jgi:hypothetical protein